MAIFGKETEPELSGSILRIGRVAGTAEVGIDSRGAAITRLEDKGPVMSFLGNSWKAGNSVVGFERSGG